MPGMDGVEFLSEAARRVPDSVRIMLTGNLDQQTAIDAVNKGDVFRFLNKPCNPDKMASTINAAIEQHRLITAEKELLEKTLTGSIGVLSDVLSMVNPDAFGKTTRVKRLVRAVARQLQLKQLWQYETMASLSQIGCVILPQELLSKYENGFELNEEESQLFNQQSSVGAHLLSKIPRLETIADSVLYQGKNFDGSGVPLDHIAGEQIPLGARILKIVMDSDIYCSRGCDSDESLKKIDANRLWYDPRILKAFHKVIAIETAAKGVWVEIEKLTSSMVLAADVVTDSNLLVVCKGQEITSFVIERLLAFKSNGLTSDKVFVVDNSLIEPAASGTI